MATASPTLRIQKTTHFRVLAENRLWVFFFRFCVTMCGKNTNYHHFWSWWAQKIRPATGWTEKQQKLLRRLLRRRRGRGSGRSRLRLARNSVICGVLGRRWRSRQVNILVCGSWLSRRSRLGNEKRGEHTERSDDNHQHPSPLLQKVRGLSNSHGLIAESTEGSG